MDEPKRKFQGTLWCQVIFAANSRDEGLVLDGVPALFSVNRFMPMGRSAK